MNKFIKKEEEISAVQFSNQTEKELKKILGDDCVLSGNAWEDTRTIVIGKQKLVVSKGMYISKSANGLLMAFKQENFEALFTKVVVKKTTKTTTKTPAKVTPPKETTETKDNTEGVTDGK